MTRNKAIAEKMGWRVVGKYYFHADNCDTEMCCKVYHQEDWAVVKSLQSRMVEDGWRIVIEHDVDGVAAMAIHPDIHERNLWPQSPNMQDEPSAIAELFCKVYGIKGD